MSHVKNVKQRPVRTASGTRSHFPEGRTTAGCNRRCNRKEVRHGSGSLVGNGFLKATFPTKPAIEVLPVLSETSYRYLYDSAKNYAGLVGRELDLEYNPKDFNSLYRAFSDGLLDDDEQVYIHEKDMRPYFTITKTVCENTLIYIPASCIDVAKGWFREILLSFFSHLEKAQRMENFSISSDYDCFNGELEYFEDNPEEVGDSEFAQLLKEYISGHIKELFEEIAATPKYDLPALSKLIMEYSPDEKERDLFLQVKEGMKFLHPGNPMIYQIDQEIDEFTEGFIPREQIMRILYSNDDITRWIIEGINDCSQGHGSYVKLGEKVITPKTKRPVTIDKHVGHFFKWVLKFIETIYDYIDEPDIKSREKF